MQDIKKMFIDGDWVSSVSGQRRGIVNPANGQIIALVTEGCLEDTEMAVRSAYRAFYEDTEWRNTTAQERSKILLEVADKLEERSIEFALLETMDNGKSLRESKIDVADAVSCFRYYAGLANKPHGHVVEVPDPVHSTVVREPIGVCALITPWNYPLLMSVWKMAPALAAGNTIVFKPSEVTPLTAIKLFEIFEEVCFPKGVVNLVLGDGLQTGSVLAASHAVDKVVFTGGTDTGRKIMQAAIGNLKKISLELGGKSPNIVFDDADFYTAIDYALFGIFANQGQVCSAGSRLLLQEGIHDKFVAELVRRTQKIKVLPGTEDNCEMGPLVSESHMEKVLDYITVGINEGATLACGGHRISDGKLKDGYFIEPTVFTNTNNEMRIVQEEIFGPVLTIQKFTSEEEAIQMANDTIFGLAGGVFTNDGAKALRVVKALRAGITWINAYNLCYNETPWGGYKQSGTGRELGIFGYEEFTEVKQININLQVQPTGWFSE